LALAAAVQPDPGRGDQAVYNPAGSVGTALRFDYAVQAGDADPDGIAIGALSLLRRRWW